jgi:hypothetical protein
VCSNILKFFFDPASPHGLGTFLLDALLKGEQIQQTNVSVEQEVVTPSGKKLDTVIETDTHIVGIENKIFHLPLNPFAEYAQYLHDRNRAGKNLQKFILALCPVDEGRSARAEKRCYSRNPDITSIPFDSFRGW